MHEPSVSSLLSMQLSVASRWACLTERDGRRHGELDGSSGISDGHRACSFSRHQFVNRNDQRKSGVPRGSSTRLPVLNPIISPNVPSLATLRECSLAIARNA